jgi:hypothetical protein
MDASGKLAAIDAETWRRYHARIQVLEKVLGPSAALDSIPDIAP